MGSSSGATSRRGRRGRVTAALAVGAVVLLVLATACGTATSDTTAPPSSSSSSSSTVLPTTTLPATTTVAPPSSTPARYTKGAPCTADVMTALLASARRWAAVHTTPDIIIASVAQAQCADDFADSGMQCAYLDKPGWQCQSTGAIFRRIDGRWELIREGDVDCSTEPDPVVRAACAAVGRAY